MKRWLFLLVCVASMSVMAKDQAVPEERYVYLDSIRAALGEMDYARAVDYAEQQMALTPGDAYVTDLYSITLYFNDEYVRALAQSNQAIAHYRKHPDMPLSMLMLTRLMLAKQVYHMERDSVTPDEMRTYIQQALRTNKKDMEAYELAVDCYVQIGDYDAAIELLKRMLVNEPTNEGWIDQLAAMYRLQGLSKAIDTYLDKYYLLGRIVKIDFLCDIEKEEPKLVYDRLMERTRVENVAERTNWQKLMVYIYRNNEQYDKALQVLDRMGENAHTYELMADRAVCLLAAQRPEEAVSVLRETIDMTYDDERGELYKALGEAHHALGEQEAEMEAYTLSLRYREDEVVRIRRAKLYMLSEDYSAAIRDLNMGEEDIRALAASVVDIYACVLLSEQFTEQERDSLVQNFVDENTDYIELLTLRQRAYQMIGEQALSDKDNLLLMELRKREEYE